MEISNLNGVKKYELEFEKVYPYFIDHIECGKTLSQLAVNRVQFRKGKFYTFLPKDAVIERLHEVALGGIIPLNQYDASGQLIDQNTPDSHIIPTTDRLEAVSLLVKVYLTQSSLHFAVIEDYLEEPSSQFSQINNVKMIPYNDEVYYFLDANNSIPEIKKTILSAEQIWHSLCLLTSIKHPLHKPLSTEILEAIVCNTSYVIVSAYDGEGYIIWERT